MRSQMVGSLLLALGGSFVAFANSSLAQPVASQTRYTCKDQGPAVFDIVYHDGCLALAVEPGWQNILSAPNVLIDIQPKSIVRDAGTAKAWIRIYLNQSYPYVTTQGQNKGSYDGTKGVYKFFCGKRQQELMQADYFNGAAVIYYRLSNEAVVEEIEPHTAIEVVYEMLCPV